MLEAIETIIGTSVSLEVRSGAPPATCATADSGTVLATIALPSDWAANAAAASKAKSGTWEDLLADASGTPGHFRIKVGGACKMQGTAGVAGGGIDMVLDAATLTAGQKFTVNTFTLGIGGG